MKTSFTELAEPYELTPDKVILEKLQLLDLKDGETLIDLGCGDARNLIAAAKLANIKCIGYELFSKAIKSATVNIQKESMLDRIEIIEDDFLNADLSKANALILYLTRFSLGQLSLKLEKELPVGARIVTHDFNIPAWEAEKVIKIRSTNSIPFTLFLYRKK